MDNTQVVEFNSRKIKQYLKSIQDGVKRKIPQNARQAAVWIWRAVRKKIKRSNSKSQVLRQEYKLYYWDWDKHQHVALEGVTPTEYIKDKKLTTPTGGRGRKHRVKEVVDFGYKRWNKKSKPGQPPMTHPASAKGWQDEWLRSNIFYSIDGGNIRIYIDTARGGQDVMEVLNALEFGGRTDVFHDYIEGYYFSTSYGYQRKRGNGVDWKGGNKKPNKSGKTRRDHFAKYTVPHIELTHKWASWGSGNKDIKARPYLKPTKEEFFKVLAPTLDYSEGN